MDNGTVPPTGANETAVGRPPARVRNRVIVAAVVVLLLILLVVLPPYISVSRYQRRVADGISASIGRPVHFDTITLHLLPLPGLTIQNFVVNDNPDFSAEPVMRANTVEARLRIASLWRRRIEVSRISLDAPSINLVRNTATGRWNLQTIVTQASQITSAPTAQKRASDAPRFPYIEASDARVNIKNGDMKLPFSMKEAEFALWLPEPDVWQLRFTGKPVRTDTDVNDVGLLKVEASLGRRADLNSAPIEMTASWKPTPLGEAAKLTAGHDMGWRGTVSAEAALKGSLGSARFTGNLHLLSLRRADLVPANTAQINLHCEAEAVGLLRSLHDVRCAVPTNEDTSMLAAIDFLRSEPAAGNGNDLPKTETKPGVLLLRADVPDLLQRHTWTVNANLADAEPDYGMAWLRLFSRRIPAASSLTGKLGLTAWQLPTGPGASRWGTSITCACVRPGGSGQASAQWTVVLNHGLLDRAEDTPAGALAVTAYNAARTSAGPSQVVAPPADSVSGEIGLGGYTLHFPSTAVAVEIGAMLPPLADGRPDASPGRLSVTRNWSGVQVWSADAAPVRKADTKRHRR